MAEVKLDGASRIQSNDGKVNIGISDNKTDMVIPVEGEDRLVISNQEIKLSQEGIAVQDSTDQESIINNTNNVFKIVDKFDMVIPSVSASTPGAGYLEGVATVTHTHSLGYKPAYLAFFDYAGDGGYRTQMPVSLSLVFSTNVAGIERFRGTVDDTTFTIKHELLLMTNTATSQTRVGGTATVYLLQEQAS